MRNLANSSFAAINEAQMKASVMYKRLRREKL